MMQTEVENFPGFPGGGISGPELVEKMQAQAVEFGARLLEGKAHSISMSKRPFELMIGSRNFTANALIVATGASAKWLGVPGEDKVSRTLRQSLTPKFQNAGISACATCDGPLTIFRNKHLFVVGGGDTAAEEALFLTRFAAKVTLLIRGDCWRASKIQARRCEEHPKIATRWNTIISEFKGEDRLRTVTFRCLQSYPPGRAK